MKKSDVFKGKFLRACDFEAGPQQYVILDVVMLEVGDENEPKACLVFEGEERMLTLNDSRWDDCEEISGESDSDGWRGCKVEVWRDPDVRFGGKKVGGLRLR